MKKYSRNIRIIAVLTLAIMLLSTLLLAIPTAATAPYGLTFTAGASYTLGKAVSEAPSTFEAEIMLPAGYTERAGIILGNYDKKPATSFEVGTNGNPILYINTDPDLNSANNIHYRFNNVNVATGKKIHLAIVRDFQSGEVRCYVDGYLKETLSISTKDTNANISLGDLALGGDFRGGNGIYFRGTIYKAAIYSDVKSSSDMLRDAVKMLPDSSAIAFYDLTNLPNVNKIVDKTGNGYDMNRSVKQGMEFVPDEKYTMSKNLEVAPYTYEATILLTENDLLEYDTKGNDQHRGGVIFGTWQGTKGLNFEIVQGAKPRLYVNDGTSNAVLLFDYNVATGQQLHLAIVIDTTANKAYCYVNGAVAQTIDIPANFLTVYQAVINDGVSFVLGGDKRGVDGTRSANCHYFKGQLVNAAMFSGARSETDIASDMNSMPTGSDTGLIAWYDTAYNTSRSNIADASGNGYGMVYDTYVYGGDLGMSFKADTVYRLKKEITQHPNTFEATVYFPADTASDARGGVILGNYGNGACVSFEVYNGGVPRLYSEGSGGNLNILFDEVSLYKGRAVHVAIVRDTATSQARCYIDGVLAQTVNCTNTADFSAGTVTIGGDLRSGNDQHFKGSIISAAMFSDVRTAEEIKTDATAISDTSDLICSYDLADLTSVETIEDKSANDYDFVRKSNWIASKDPVTDYAYSFAVIGDTQIIARDEVDGKLKKGSFAKIYDYVINNKDSKKIKFVMGLGDITDTSDWYSAEEKVDIPAEWELAMSNIKRMDGVVPYSIVRGNHDGTSDFNKYVKYDDYKNVIDGSYEQNMLNTYQELVVGEVKYLIFTFDYGADNNVLNWASDVIAAHPTHNVILTTHAYLYRNGTTLDSTEVCPPDDPRWTTDDHLNNGDEMWEKLVKKHDNIVLVLSGHDPCDTVVVSKAQGEKGNTVTQMLIDPQGIDASVVSTGMVAMLYFSEDGRNVSVEWYSTIQEMYFREENQFTTTLDLVEPDYTALETAISAAEAKNEEDYTSTSWVAMQQKLTAAIAARGSYLQSVVTNAANELNAAVTGLIEKPASAPQLDFAALNAAISAAAAKNQADYTAASWSAMQSALTAAREALNANEQSKINSAAIALNTAVANLVPKPQLNLTALNAAIGAAEAKTEADYTEASWSAMQSALTAAREALNADEQSEIDSAVTALNTAVTNLVPKQSGDTSGGGNAGGGENNEGAGGNTPDNTPDNIPDNTPDNTPDATEPVQDATDAATDEPTDAATDETENVDVEVGCGSAMTVSALSVTAVAILASLVTAKKKRED